MFQLSFNGGHICCPPYTVATRLLASAGPVAHTGDVKIEKDLLRAFSTLNHASPMSSSTVHKTVSSRPSVELVHHSR